SSFRCASGGVRAANCSTLGSGYPIAGSSAGVGSSACWTVGRHSCPRRARGLTVNRPARCRPTSTALVTPTIITRMVGSTPKRRTATAESSAVSAKRTGRLSRRDTVGTTARGEIPGGGSVQVAEERRDPLAAADAHRDDAPFGLAPLQLVGEL